MQDYVYNLTTDKYKGFIPATIKVFLFVLSLIYGLVVRILIFFYQLSPYRLNCKVISVGNITLGGTGKTTLVEFIAKYLKKHGHKKVAILTRGYKRKTIDYRLSLPAGQAGTIDCETMGDEPYMLQMSLKYVPVIVDADRIRAGNRAIRDYGADTVILDDGFQQWKIKKDLEIVTIDATNPFGNRHLIPRGILREPLSSLKRADMFVLTKTNLNGDIDDIKDFLYRSNSQAIIIESYHWPLGFYNIDIPKELFNTGFLEGQNVTLLSGIGDPDSFENLIASLGIKIGLSFRFGDHYNYTKEDLDKIIKSSRDKNIDTIITTEKDAVRLQGLRSKVGGLRVLVLKIELKIKDEQRFYNRLLRLFSL